MKPPLQATCKSASSHRHFSQQSARPTRNNAQPKRHRFLGMLGISKKGISYTSCNRLQISLKKLSKMSIRQSIIHLYQNNPPTALARFVYLFNFNHSFDTVTWSSHPACTRPMPEKIFNGASQPTMVAPKTWMVPASSGRFTTMTWLPP